MEDKELNGEIESLTDGELSNEIDEIIQEIYEFEETFNNAKKKFKSLTVLLGKLQTEKTLRDTIDK